MAIWGISIEDVLLHVENNNLSLQVSSVNQEKAILKTQQIQNSQFGTLALYGNYTLYNDDRTLAPMTPPIAPNTPTDDRILSVGASYRVVLFDGFGMQQDVEIAKLGNTMAALQHNQTIWSLKRNVVSLYMAGLKLQQNKSLQIEHLDALNKLETVIKEEEQIGRRAQVEVMQIETERMRTSAGLAQIDGELSNILLAIERLMNTKKKINILEPVEMEDAKTLPSIIESEVEQTSPIQMAKMQINQAQKAYNKAKSSNLPKVTFETLYSRNYGDGEHENVYQASLGFQWLAFDFGVRNKQIEQAHLEYLRATIEAQNQKEILLTSLAQAQTSIQKAQESYNLAIQEAKLAKVVESIEYEKLKEGVITMQSYLLQKVASHRARVNKETARYALLEQVYHYLILLEKPL
jgi:outer membrane protein TolC